MIPVASSLQQLNKLYKVGLPLSDYMTESLNVTGKHHMEKSSLENLMGKQICPANIDLQGGQISNARGKDGSFKKVNNIIQKSMIPLMCVADKLYLADTTETEAPSMKAVFDQCMTSLTLLCKANLEVETLHQEAFKPTTT